MERKRKTPETSKMPGFSLVRPMRFERTTFRVGGFLPCWRFALIAQAFLIVPNQIERPSERLTAFFRFG